MGVRLGRTTWTVDINNNLIGFRMVDPFCCLDGGMRAICNDRCMIADGELKRVVADALFSTLGSPHVSAL